MALLRANNSVLLVFFCASLFHYIALCKILIYVFLVDFSNNIIFFSLLDSDWLKSVPINP